MPIVQITILEGRTQDQKDAMYKEVTAALSRTLNTPPENVRIILHESALAHFAVAGVSKAKTAQPGG